MINILKKPIIILNNNLNNFIKNKFKKINLKLQNQTTYFLIFSINKVIKINLIKIIEFSSMSQWEELVLKS